MPLYEYQCRACGKVTDVRHGFGETPSEACPACGGELVRRFSPAGIVFKGSGFYVTDSRKAAEATAKASSSKSDAKADGKAETPAATSSDAPKAEPAKASESTSGGADSTPKKGEGAAA